MNELPVIVCPCYVIPLFYQYSFKMLANYTKDQIAYICRALEDIKESITELRFYKQTIFK